MVSKRSSSRGMVIYLAKKTCTKLNFDAGLIVSMATRLRLVGSIQWLLL